MQRKEAEEAEEERLTSAESPADLSHPAFPAHPFFHRRRRTSKLQPSRSPLLKKTLHVAESWTVASIHERYVLVLPLLLVMLMRWLPNSDCRLHCAYAWFPIVPRFKGYVDSGFLLTLLFVPWLHDGSNNTSITPCPAL
jgi:hypothetical protein